MTDSRHTQGCDPQTYRRRLSELPTTAIALPDALENFVIHHAIARLLGYSMPPAAERDRDLRLVSRLLATAEQRDACALLEHRNLANYLYCTCRDFALLAVSALREDGTPARLRVGSASYLKSEHWEDHWVCEHRAGAKWAVLDAQLGPCARTALRISFDIADVPATGWQSAASVWRAIRSGEIDPAKCGVSFVGISGAWFVASAVLRDAAALVGIECLPWDYWGPGRSFWAARDITEEQTQAIDSLAEALDPAPASRVDAEATLAHFPWARPTPTALSFSGGTDGSEVDLVPI